MSTLRTLVNALKVDGQRCILSLLSQRVTSFYMKSEFPEAYQLSLLGVEPFLRTLEGKKKKAMEGRLFGQD